MTVWGLRSWVGFSLVAASVGALSSCGAWTSRCGAKALGRAGSVVVVLRGTWGLPGPQIEPVSPALVSNFFTTEPSGKPMLFLKKKNHWSKIPYLFVSLQHVWHFTRSDMCITKPCFSDSFISLQVPWKLGQFFPSSCHQSLVQYLIQMCPINMFCQLNYLKF